MAAGTLQLELDPGQALRLGGPLRGALVVQAHEDTVSPLLLVRLVRTTWLGERSFEQTHLLARLEPADPWIHGMVARVPFEVQLPDGPPTAEGAHMRVGWELVVSPRTGLELEPVRRPLVLGSPLPRLPTSTPLRFEARRQQRLVGWLVAVGGLGLFSLSVSLDDPALGATLSLTAAGLTGGLLGVALPVAWWMDRRDLRFDVRCEAPERVTPGEPLPLGLDVADARGGRLEEVRVELRCSEWKQRATTALDVSLLPAPRRLERGDGWRYRGTLTVPSALKPTVVVPRDDVNLDAEGAPGDVTLLGAQLRVSVRIGKRTLVLERPVVVVAPAAAP